jgi:hypothetical protein
MGGLAIVALPPRPGPLLPLGTAVAPEAWAEVGYVEQEHLVSGVADVHGPGDPANADPPTLSRAEIVPLGAVTRTAVPFTTRIVVRRPADPARANGVVVFEPIHNAGEIVPSWAVTHRHHLQEGATWIGVTVSTGAHVGVDGAPRGGVALLQVLDPERYGSLRLEPGDAADWPLLAPRDLDRDLEGKGLVDVLADSTFNGGADSASFGVLIEEIYRSYAHSPGVMAQLAALVRSGDPSSPLAGYPVERVYGTGASGTTVWWNAFLDGGHHERSRVFDGFVLYVATPPRTRPDDAVLVSIQSEAEAVLAVAEGDPVRGDEHPRFRQYEIAGTGHRLCGSASPWIGNEESGWATLAPTAAPGNGDLVPFDRVVYPVLHELWRRLDAWVDGGEPMPPSVHITRDPAAADGLARDAHGNAVGGVRTPWVDAPDAHYVARSPGNPLRAALRPFGPGRMKTLYGSQDGYRQRFRAAVSSLVAQGWVRADEAGDFS